MTGAMYASIAGLKTHMSKLNVIGNNVANVNTYGYKSTRAVFSDTMYTTSKSGSNGTQFVGGRNPSQVGYGVNVRSIDLNMTTGNFAATGYTMDCMIDGDGFFLTSDRKDTVVDPTDPSTMTLSRLGTFYFGPDGYLTDGENVVYGFQAIGTYIDKNGEEQPLVSKQLTPIRLPTTSDDGKQTYWPKEVVTGTGANATVSIVDRDPQSATFDQTTGAITKYPDPATGDTSSMKRVTYSSLSIDGKTGKITGINNETKKVQTLGYIAIGTVSNPNGVTHQGGPYYKAMEGAGQLKVASIGGAIKGNMNSTVAAAADLETGFGTLGQDKLDQTTQEIGYADMQDKAEVGIADTGKTVLQTGGLELSGADLATEISEMITTQRGYQANTRIVTVTDSMLEELVNMKR